MSERIDKKCCATCQHLETKRKIEKSLGTYYVNVQSFPCKCSKKGHRIDVVGVSGRSCYEQWVECYKKSKEQEDEKRRKEEEARIAAEKREKERFEEQSKRDTYVSQPQTRHSYLPKEDEVISNVEITSNGTSNKDKNWSASNIILNIVVGGLLGGCALGFAFGFLIYLPDVIGDEYKDSIWMEHEVKPMIICGIVALVSAILVTLFFVWQGKKHKK